MRIFQNMKYRPAAARMVNDQRGNSLVEGALVLPMLLSLLLGGYELSRAIAIDLDLEQAAQSATSLALAKPPMHSGDTAYIAQAATAAAKGQASAVTVDAYKECNGQRMASVTSVCGGQYQEAYYVSVQVKGTYTPTVNLPELPAVIALNGDSVVRIQ